MRAITEEKKTASDAEQLSSCNVAAATPVTKLTYIHLRTSSNLGKLTK